MRAASTTRKSAAHAAPRSQSKPSKAKAKAAVPVAPKVSEVKDRGAMFDGRDMNKDGKLNKEEFLIRQSDPEQAAKNFVKFDKDKSGDVNREEYVTSGK